MDSDRRSDKGNGLLIVQADSSLLEALTEAINLTWVSNPILGSKREGEPLKRVILEYFEDERPHLIQWLEEMCQVENEV
jgi:hypothetical protein